MSKASNKNTLGFTRAELEQVNIFQGVDLNLIEPLLSNAAVQILQNGEVLIAANQPNHYMYLLLSGRLRIHVDSPDNAPVSRLDIGEAVGEMSLFDRLPTSTFVVADKESRVLRLDEQTMWLLSEKSHAVSNNLLSMLSKRLRQFTGMVQQRNESLQKQIKALQESEERYELAMRGAREGLWDWTLDDHTIYLSPHAILVFKLDPEQSRVSDDEWIKRLHPEDRPLWHAALTAHLRGDRDGFEGEFRMLNDGEYRWIFCCGLGLRNEQGRIYRMAGSVSDITERKQQQAERARIESELKVGREIQMSMLPLTFPAFPERNDLDLYAMLEPAREVGGDLYDFFFVDPHRLCICIGDVTGKGVPAALFMAVTKTLIKAKAADDFSPANILTYVNNELSKDNPSCIFVTLFIGLCDTRTGIFSYANAGHNFPYLLHAGQNIQELSKNHGPIAGMLENISYQENQTEMHRGDTFFAFTDGVTDAMNEDEELFSDQRLRDLLKKHRHQTARPLVKNIISEVQSFSNNVEQTDDITLLAMTYYGKRRIDKD